MLPVLLHAPCIVYDDSPRLLLLLLLVMAQACIGQ
jgi:hypothetical protein